MSESKMKRENRNSSGTARVCHITSVHKNDDPRIFQKECTSLSAAGYTVYFVAPGNSREEAGVRVVGLGAKPARRLQRMTKFAQKAYETALALDCDIYHIHDPELLPYALKLKRKGKKVIFDSHEYYPLQIAEKNYLPRWFRKTASYLYTKYETYVFKKIDGVIIPCTVDGKNVLNGRAKHSAIITNAVKLADFPINSYSGGEREQTICYTGRLAEERGITNLILAAFQANAKLVLAGAISKDYLARLQQMPEFSCVDYLGVVDYSAVKDIYARSSVGAQLWQPSGQYYHVDVLGVKVMEYMAMKLPMIVSDTPYMREIVGKYSCGICVGPTDINAIADAIRLILDDPRTAVTMGENGRRAVEKEFSWEMQAETLIALYKLLLK